MALLTERLHTCMYVQGIKRAAQARYIQPQGPRGNMRAFGRDPLTCGFPICPGSSAPSGARVAMWGTGPQMPTRQSPGWQCAAGSRPERGMGQFSVGERRGKGWLKR